MGSGKTSLLKSVIGDLIYLADHEITSLGFGGADVELDEKQLDTWKKRILAPEYYDSVVDKPIRIDGKLAFVEQNPWI